MRGHESVVGPSGEVTGRSDSEIAREAEEVSSKLANIQGLLGQNMLTQMHEPFKHMRVIF